MKKILIPTLLLTACFSLTGCVAAAVGTGAAVGGYAVAKDKGPVGQYTSDSVITSKIKTKFIANSELKSLNISVATNNGHVTLTGTVPTFAMRQTAISIASKTEGVKSVNVTNLVTTR